MNKSLDQASALLEQGDFAAAEACLREILSADAPGGEASQLLGIVFAQQGRLEEAAAVFSGAVQADPGSATANANMANILKCLGKPELALRYFDAAIAIEPGNAAHYSNRGSARRDLGLHQEALQDCRAAVAMTPDFADALYNMGLICQDLERRDEALFNYSRVIAIAPGYAAAYNNRGVVLQALQRHAEALQDFGMALELNPRDAGALANRGISLYRLSQHAEALRNFDLALELNPGHSETLMNKGVVHQRLQDWDAAMACYRAALAANPRNADAHRNLALCHLLLGQLDDGWREYDWRWQTRQYSGHRLHGDRPEWDGRPVAGTLLVWGEQGIGDQIFFARMLPQLESHARQIAVSVDERLLPLFRRSFPGCRMIPAQEAGSACFDAHVSIGGLGKFFSRQFPVSPQPYLRACETRVLAIRGALAAGAKRVCGLSWISGNPESGREKSLPLRVLEPLFQAGDILPVDLQYGDTAAERETFAAATGHVLKHIDGIDNFKDIDSLAALIGACDFVVTVSNTTAHLAAALGKPVYLLLPESSTLLWYWHVTDSAGRWYPSVRIFRPGADGGWGKPVLEMVQSLPSWRADALQMQGGRSATGSARRQQPDH